MITPHVKHRVTKSSISFLGMLKLFSHVHLYATIDHTVNEILQARILEWVTFPFSRGPTQPRDQTQVSHIAGGFFTS